ncbi:MAG: hypothetical protein L0241_21945 [Planctomycetia bacterium]|nr:hypothetical protein [Planctomycetia bacterium]
METIFLICAILGGTIVVCQLAAGLLGFGGFEDADTDHDAGDTGGDVDHDDGHGNMFFGLLSVRTATAALLFFGLGGMTALYYGASEMAAFGIAVGSGVLALYLVALAMRSLTKLKAEGTARIERSVGRAGTVYLRIPASKTGPGKIHLMLQNRTVEYQAITAGDELPTGTPIKVVAVINSDTVEVEAA